MMHRRTAAWLTLCAVMVAATTAHGAFIGVTSDKAGSVVNYPFSLGYVFSVSEAVDVTALGQFDIKGDGAAASAKIALFNWDTGAKITETTLAGAVLEETGHYDTHFVDITPVALTTGTRYLLAVEVLNYDFTYGTGIMTFDSTIGWVEGRATPVGSPAMPATATTTTFSIQRAQDQCYFGPNMKLTPEPTSIALIGLGGLALIRRRAWKR